MYILLQSKYIASFAALVGAAVGLTCISSQAQGSRSRPSRAAAPAVPGEVLVRLSPGADAEQIAAARGLQLKRKLRFAPATYVFSSSSQSPQEAAAALLQAPGVLAASPNHTFKPAAVPPVVPDDPLLEEQWALRLTGAPNLWGITVGQRYITPDNAPFRTATVAVLDFGIFTQHPDLSANIDPNGFDFILDQPHDDFTSGDFTLRGGHGTQVAGCVAAVTNNAEGIASYPWEGVSILPCRVGETVPGPMANTTVRQIRADAVTDAIYYCIQAPQLFGGRVDIINMSFEATPTPQAEFPIIQQAISEAYAAGIVMVASTGDSPLQAFNGIVQFPATEPEVIPVGAVGRSGELAAYSNTGFELALRGLVAPGGNDPQTTDTSRLLVLPDSSFGYTSFPGVQGTSYAAGYVSGAIATLITQGARNEALASSDQVEQLRSLIRDTARNNQRFPTSEFGAGVLDVDAAIRASTHYIDVIAPQKNEITASFSEPLTARIVQPDGSPLAIGNFQVFQNGVDVTPLATPLATAPDTLEYEPGPTTRYNIGANSLNVVAKSTIGLPDRSLEGPAVTDIFGRIRIPARSFRIRVIPRVEQPGLKLFSVPYELQFGADTLEFLFGGNLIRLARWLPDEQRYAIFDAQGAPQDPEASLTTGASGVARPPVGTGFFARIIAPTQVQLLGRSERAQVYEIPLQFDYNLIGNPYQFRVPFNVLNVRYGNETFSIAEAASRKIISNLIWRFEDGRYTFKALPAGELVPWEGHWVRVLKSDRPVSLLVPRVATTLNPQQPGQLSLNSNGVDGWRTSVQAHVDGKLAGEAFLGARSTASEGYGSEDVATPPPAPGPVDLRIRRADWGRHSGRYAQDIRRDLKKTQSWTMELETYRPGVPVKLTWGKLPARSQAYVQLAGDVRKHRLRVGGTLRVPAPRAGVQRLTVTVVPQARA